MAGALRKIVNLSKSINTLTKLFANASISSNNATTSSILNTTVTNRCQRLSFHYNPLHQNAAEMKKDEEMDKEDELIKKNHPGLMEFFDDPKNWGARKVKAGRAWTKEELRLKSNEDLHKLWFVLLKERNMLKTMEHSCNEEYHVFPNPERIDKVEDSMENLEKVVQERNKAYYMLETGENGGVRPSKVVHSPLGLKYWYRTRQYRIPRFLNKKFNMENSFSYGGYAVQKFRKLYFEKLWLLKRSRINKSKRDAAKYFRNFPNVDPEAIQQEFPHLTLEMLEKVKKSSLARPFAR